MSNETKRDVFGQLLNAYQNLSMKDIQIPNENYRENITTPWNTIYDAAIPDDLPTIPLAVSEEIKGSYGSLSLRDELDIADSISDDPSVIDYIENSESVFAEAWSRGLWIVKETGEVTGYDEQ